MEPLSIFGLAVNIVQLVDFAARLLREAREIHQSAAGQSADNLELHLIAESLSRMCAIVPPKQDSRGNWGIVSHEVTKIAQATNSVASELISVIERLQLSGESKRKWRSFRQAISTLWNKDKIDNLQSRLGELRSQLQVNLVTYISSEQQHISRNLSKLRKQCESVNPRRLEAIRETTEHLRTVALPSLNSSVLNSIEEVFRKTQAARMKIDREKSILESLTFTTMYDRYHTITDAHKTTFKWIFEPFSFPLEDPRSQITFDQWLMSGDGIFWVTGKPGSGKSTLMKFLHDCPQTQDRLEHWAGSSKLFTASFYFWLAGSGLQRSQVGLLRQLLFEILREHPNLMPSVIGKRWIEDTMPSQSWNLTDLQEAFENLHCVSEDTKICFFIDGLDEYDGDHLDLIKILKKISKIQNIKLCVASRPWPQFSDAFGQSPKLTLHLEDLTRDDIRRFARDKLGELPNLHYLEQTDNDYFNLVEVITDRAQGVFLWVYLVVRSLREGISNGDNSSLLQQRLDEIPTDLEAFFEKLLKSVDKIYRKHMSLTFQTALHANEPINVVVYWLLDENISHPSELPSTQVVNQRDIEVLELGMMKRLNGRYKGLLETSGQEGARTVNFLHRTVRDYLRTKAAFDMLIIPGLDPCSKACKAMLDYLTGFRYRILFERQSLEDFMMFACLAKDQNEEMDFHMVTQMMYAAHSSFGSHEPFFVEAACFGHIQGLRHLLSTAPEILSEFADVMMYAALDEHPTRARQLYGSSIAHETVAWLYSHVNWWQAQISPEMLFMKFLSCNKRDSSSLYRPVAFPRWNSQEMPVISRDQWQVFLDIFLENGADPRVAFGLATGIEQNEIEIEYSTAFVSEFPWIGKWYGEDGDSGRQELFAVNPTKCPPSVYQQSKDGPEHARVCLEDLFNRNLQAYSSFLSHGLDPNIKIGDYTLWQMWIWYIAEAQTSHGFLEDACAKAIELFLSHGAEIHATCEYSPGREPDLSDSCTLSVYDLVDSYFGDENRAKLRRALEAAKRRQVMIASPEWETVSDSKGYLESSHDYNDIGLMGRGKGRM